MKASLAPLHPPPANEPVFSDPATERPSRRWVNAPIGPSCALFLENLERLTEEQGRSPSLRELAAAQKVSLRRVHQIVARLSALGLVTKEFHRHRTLRIVEHQERAGNGSA